MQFKSRKMAALAGTIALGLGLVLCTGLSAQVPGYQNMSHLSATGTYGTSVPSSYGQIETLHQEIPSAAGVIVANGYQVVNEMASAAMLALIHYQAPVGFEQGRTAEVIVTDTIEGLVSGIGGSITTRRSVTFNGSTGIEGDFAANFEGLSLVGRARVFLIGTEAVGVYFLAMGSGNPPADAMLLSDPTGNAFLDSLSFASAVPTSPTPATPDPK